MRMDISAEGESITYIWDDASNTAYIIYESAGMVMQTTYEEQETAFDETEGLTDFDYTIIGTETYDGKVCTVVQYTADGATTKMWIWEEWGFPIKVEVTSSDGTSTVEYTDIEFNNVSDDVFDLPEGYMTMTV